MQTSGFVQQGGRGSWCGLVTTAVVVGKLDRDPRDGISAVDQERLFFRSVNEINRTTTFALVLFWIRPDWTAILDARGH